MLGPLLQEFIEVAAECVTVEDLRALCTEICDALEFDFFLYGARFPSSLTNPFVFAVTNYPAAWRKRYDAQGYIAVDPIVSHSEQSVRPLSWREFAALEAESAQVAAFFADARAHGLVSGFSIPVHGCKGDAAVLSFSARAAGAAVEARIATVMADAHLLAAHVHEAAVRMVEAGQLPFKPTLLSQREKDCLLWAAEGKTSWETARIVGISERTVVFHLHNAARKLGVNNRQQAVARAVAQGLLTPKLS